MPHLHTTGWSTNGVQVGIGWGYEWVSGTKWVVERNGWGHLLGCETREVAANDGLWVCRAVVSITNGKTMLT